MNAILVSGDLMTISRVEGAASRVGVLLHSVATADSAIGYCGEQPIGLVVVDLSTRSLEIASLVDRLKATTNRMPKILAFGPHVHDALLTAAEAAGCDEVITRGQFFAQLDELLARHASASG